MDSKAHVMLRALKARRKLKEICDDFNISYKYCFEVSKGTRAPSWSLINKFLYLIPARYWFETPSTKFINQIKARLNNIDYTKLSV